MDNPVEMKKNLGGLRIAKYCRPHHHGWLGVKIFHFKSSETARKT